MTVLSPPRHPMVSTALDDARRWCAGHEIDDRPALAHAARVAVTLGHHVPDAPPDLIAAALLHDAPDFVPDGVDLDADLTARYNPKVVRIVRGLEAEHRALDTGHPIVHIEDIAVLLASTADKIVALTSLTHRACKTEDTPTFFARRPRLLALLEHFRAFALAGNGRVPASMTSHLHQALTDLNTAAEPR